MPQTMPSTPQNNTTYTDQTPLYSSSVLANYTNYIAAHHPDVDIDELLHCSELTRFDLNDKGYFLSQEQVNRFHRCLDERVADPELAYKAGRHTIYAKSTGTMKQYGLRFFTPASLYKAVDRLYPKWARGHTSKAVITSKSRAELTVSVCPGVQEKPFQCENRRGILESIGNLLTNQSVQIDHPRCMHRGDSA